MVRIDYENKKIIVPVGSKLTDLDVYAELQRQRREDPTQQAHEMPLRTYTDKKGEKRVTIKKDWLSISE